MIDFEGDRIKNPDNLLGNNPAVFQLESFGEKMTLLTATDIKQLDSYNLNIRSTEESFFKSPDMQYAICSIYTGLTQELKPMLDRLGRLGSATALVKIDFFNKEVVIKDAFYDFSMNIANFVKLANCVVQLWGNDYSYTIAYNDRPIAWLNTNENGNWERSVSKEGLDRLAKQTVEDTLGFSSGNYGISLN